MTDPEPRGEFDLIAWIRRHAPATGRAGIGIGDDCAALRVSPGAELLVTTDMLMDGRHFRLDRDGPEAVGYKALAVNLSDIAAMAGRPIAAVVAVALPRGAAILVAQGLQRGMTPLAERFGVELAGGDTNAWDGPLVVSVTLLGETTPRGPVRRSGARPGDLIYVTGPLGGSLLGRHLHPEPRIAEALALHERADLHALIDISDGLLADLGHILEESGGLGAVLDEGSVPIHPDAQTMSRQDGRPPLNHALNDGEDFELCLVVDPGDAPQVEGSGVWVRRVGTIVTDSGLWFRDEDGGRSPIAPRGFDHLRD